MSERLDLVAKFLSFGDSNPLEPMELDGAICEPSDFDSTDHGSVTVVVCYFTPFTDTSGSLVTLSFGLGPDVTVSTIFRLPILGDLDSVIWLLSSDSLHSRSPLNLDFPIT
jgi:hypothetical protein